MATAKKLDSIGLRISFENKEIIRIAGGVYGPRPDELFGKHSSRKGEKDIKDHKEMQNILLSTGDFSKIEKGLAKPSKANDKLKKAFKAHSKKIEE